MAQSVIRDYRAYQSETHAGECGGHARPLFNGKNMSRFDSYHSKYACLIWTYSLMVKLPAHNGRSVVRFHLTPPCSHRQEVKPHGFHPCITSSNLVGSTIHAHILKWLKSSALNTDRTEMLRRFESYCGRLY